MHAETKQYCLDTEPYAPHGLILKLSGQYYRICRPWTDNGDWRQLILSINPALVPDLMSQHSPSNLRLREDTRDGDWYAFRARLDPHVGTRTFGDAVYQAYESEIRGSNGRPGGAVYIYFPGDNPNFPNVPKHLVTCGGESRIDEGWSFSCNVALRKDGVVASLLFIGSNERGFAYMDHFHEFAQDIVRVLEVANVTDEIDQLSGFLDIVD
ncbi:hypothetical protein [Pseudohalocynthiibacter sp. F2068]|uniref:hypothetical protein n=1 Tax=Pseudohalocynthiibacter sp. F2068 TaxID=2926418 RepID=UPI001FF42022|nr:hypothetical protein [Pseudohalocynthiibacter sp. F2068]MCK0103093.1 hypothetical protein [Pseudohalocynthiibacter sp. F2068]